MLGDQFYDDKFIQGSYYAHQVKLKHLIFATAYNFMYDKFSQASKFHDLLKLKHLIFATIYFQAKTKK